MRMDFINPLRLSVRFSVSKSDKDICGQCKNLRDSGDALLIS